MEISGKMDVFPGGYGRIGEIPHGPIGLTKIRKGLVMVTFPSHLQYLNGSLSKS